jgi:hypothetical protein
LLNDLHAAFDESELAEFCFKLSVNYEDLGGKGRRGNARALIEYMQWRQQLPQLVQALVKERPSLEKKYAAYLQQPGISQTITGIPDVPEETKDIPPPPAHSPTTTPGGDQLKVAVNPYNAGPMVTNKEMFFGRRSELRRLRANLLNMGSSSIVGIRRIGKSSLLYYLSHYEPLPPDHRFLFAYLDLQDGRYHTLTNLLSGAFHQWVSQVGEGVPPPILDLAGFSRMVRSLNKDSYQLVLCLDEFENLTKRPHEFSDDTFEAWRALANERQIAFVTASQHPLADLIKSGGLTSNFYNIFTQLDLGLLDEASARDLLAIPMTRQGLSVPTLAVDELLSFCGNYPFYLQMGAFYFCDALTSGVSYDMTQVKEDFAWAADRHWDGLWRALSPEEQLAFPVAWEKAATPLAEKQCRLMDRKGLLVREGEGYKPFSQGFVEWIRSLPAEAKPDNPPQSANPDFPQEAKDEKDSAPTTTKPEGTQSTANQVSITLLLVATAVTVVILVVAAWVLTSLLEVKSVGNLVLVLAILFPFILVLVGKLAGQDFVGWLGNLLGKK